MHNNLAADIAVQCFRVEYIWWDEHTPWYIHCSVWTGSKVWCSKDIWALIFTIVIMPIFDIDCINEVVIHLNHELENGNILFGFWHAIC